MFELGGGEATKLDGHLTNTFYRVIRNPRIGLNYPYYSVSAFPFSKHVGRSNLPFGFGRQYVCSVSRSELARPRLQR